VLDAVDQNSLILILDFVENAVNSNADTIALCVSEFLHSKRPWIVSKLGNAGSDFLNFTRW
jgi:hypothetical protein